ncbi:MAG TPA: hypothetical protein PLV10_06280 [Candidatus Latescibacteria bacterium]|nr:hypothetical protein [Candidatus Latescibacterota bacterium]
MRHALPERGTALNPIKTYALARIGLLGNPSDGYFGKTISCAITNFSATVTLEEGEGISIIPHPTSDPFSFESLANLRETAIRQGYEGGYRLIYATCKKFADYCAKREIVLPPKGFTIRYDTTIPRQVGLAGSSAIITALTKGLRTLFGITESQFPLEIQPSFVLSVEEEELDIRAGLQDRVIQTYGGVVYMDFDRELLLHRGYGRYVQLDPRSVPPLFLAYVNRPKDSGKAHSDVRARWSRGDEDVILAMREFADFAEQGREALAQRDWAKLGDLMNRNFDLRLRLFGEKVIGDQNLEMVKIARSLGAPAKFPGSGGAVIGIWKDGDHFERLREAFASHGYAFTNVQVENGPQYPV